MIEKERKKLREAYLVKKICVLSGELLECYQWQEETIDAVTSLSLIQSMKQTLQVLEEQIKATKQD